jgi:hypothetical protein
MEPQQRILIEKLKRLPAERLAAVEDYVDFLSRREEARRLLDGGATADDAASINAWGVPEDKAGAA